MLPRWHIFYGLLFSFLIWIFSPSIDKFYLLLIFLSSVFIDLDHYIASVIKTGKISLFKSFNYHKKRGIEQLAEKKRGIREKGDFHLFHTIEFHALIGIIGIFWQPFFYIFTGMIFHSLLDLIWLKKTDYLYRREFFFFKWIRNKFD